MADVDNRLDREDGIRTMDALDKLKEIDLEEITPLEAAIVYLSHKHEGDATMAAAELAALRERAEKAEAERDAIQAERDFYRRQFPTAAKNWQVAIAGGA